MSSALDRLASRVPGLRVVHSEETGAPEIVGARGFTRLTPPSQDSTESVSRRFVEAHAGTYGLSTAQAEALELDADYQNPAGNISWVRFTQRIHDLPVFRGMLTVAMTRDREIFRTAGQIAPFVRADLPPPRPSLSPREAVAAAASELGISVSPEDLVESTRDARGVSAVFERGPFAGETKVELLWFPLGSGALELAWSVTLWREEDAHTLLVSAEDGLLLFRKNLTSSSDTPRSSPRAVSGTGIPLPHS